MNCVCGSVVEANSTCTDCGRIHDNCDACGGQVIAMPKTMILACPYCDTPLHSIDADAVPYFPINFTPKEIETQLNHFLLNRFGIPDDFVAKRKVIRSTLSFVPIRLYTVQAFLNEQIFEVDTKVVILNSDLWYLSKIQSYRFSVRVKQVMQPETVDAVTHAINLSDDKADQQAEQFGGVLLGRDKSRFSEVESNSKIECTIDGDVFYPLYEIYYQYGVKEYRAIVDASNGVVCFSEHPMCMKCRAAVGTAGMLMLIVTLVFTVLFAFVGISNILAPFVVFCIGVLGSGNIFWTAIRDHSGKEICEPDTSSDKVFKPGQLDVADRKLLGPVEDV